MRRAARMGAFPREAYVAHQARAGRGRGGAGDGRDARGNGAHRGDLADRGEPRRARQATRERSARSDPARGRRPRSRRADDRARPRRRRTDGFAVPRVTSLAASPRTGFESFASSFPTCRRAAAAGACRRTDRRCCATAGSRSSATLGGAERLVIGGKSLGGRIASLVADEVSARGPRVHRLPVSSARQAASASRRASANAANADADRAGTRDALGSQEEVGRLLALAGDSSPLDRGRRSFAEAAGTLGPHGIAESRRGGGGDRRLRRERAPVESLERVAPQVALEHGCRRGRRRNGRHWATSRPPRGRVVGQCRSRASRPEGPWTRSTTVTAGKRAPSAQMSSAKRTGSIEDSMACGMSTESPASRPLASRIVALRSFD